MVSLNALIAVCVVYAAALFAIAFWADRRAAAGRLGWLGTPLVYTLSLSVYCTGWTFYGAVGSAARSGLEFVTIYLGPSLVLFCWWYIPRKLVRIGQTQRITSIADLISSRYGKSTTLGVVVTLLALIATTPYIALQLQSLSLSVATLSGGTPGNSPQITALWFAIGLALFAILFGTRSINANERHFGVVSAIAVEAVVKLGALLAVGIFAVWGLSDGPAAAFVQPDPVQDSIFVPRWVTLTFLSATAVICLPRMFQVMVVENADERHLATAAWAFPAYLLLISIFVLPIALTGQRLLPADANPDLYVLTLPLSHGQTGLGLLAFLGGFSAATSMVIVSSIALSTMISNHIVVPVWLWAGAARVQTAGDVRNVVLRGRRLSIGLILGLGYAYFVLTGGTGALASIGLISFAGIAQILPALIGAIYWRGATRSGALAGILAGFALWAYTLLLPAFGDTALMSAAVLAEGPFGIGALRPQALMGATPGDPLIHSVSWSLAVNTLAFVLVSLLSRPALLERVQAAQFVDVFRQPGRAARPVIHRSATSEDLFTLAQRILGTNTAHGLFTQAARAQGKSAGLPDATAGLIARVERDLSGAVGSASAHAMVSQITGAGQISVDELIRMADEAAQILEYSHRLERQSRQMTRTADQLRAANAKLTELAAQKDAFLSQVSHELRTPMTSIRAFADILRNTADLPSEQTTRFAGIIHDETARLTRLLDEILDLSFLESGRVTWKMERIRLGDVVDAAVAATGGLHSGIKVEILPRAMDLEVEAEFDRLSQVIINMISNAVKYGHAEGQHRIEISAAPAGTMVHLDILDDGPGIRPSQREKAFEKFSRLSSTTLAGSAGLGLPISREIMRNLGGELTLENSARGARFRLALLRAGKATRAARAG